jgi:citrate/tricarballylate utilization protein
LLPLTELIARVRAEGGQGAGADLLGTALAHGEEELARVLQICNSCRYCEGFCAVFPAMTRRLDFGKADVHYLDNLCHNCGACLPACQYALPHEFNVNVPKVMAQVRMQTYQDYAWPRALGALYRQSGLTTALALAGGFAIFFLSLVAARGSLRHAPMAADFYAIFPHDVLAWSFGLVFAFAVVLMAIGACRFWLAVSPHDPVTSNGRPLDLWSSGAAAEAVHDVLTLKYLGGGHGEGCSDQDDRFTLWRRRFHHATFYGFMLCFASTAVATLYHYALNRHAPYALTSLPVVLGTVGGVALIVGTLGLLWAGLRRNPAITDAAQRPMDRAFITLLLMTGFSGIALLTLRESGYMGVAFAFHLGVVLALFLTLPYGKFAHGIYRAVALLKFAVEKRSPNRLLLGED